MIGAEPIESPMRIEHLLLDTRKLHDVASSLFFALGGTRRDGHQFISTAYEQGVRAFVLSRPIDRSSFPDAIFLQVPDTLAALQRLAADHRAAYTFPVVGITGSNGKTIVKEWLWQVLHRQFQIVRSPRSFNSQIGVPLSVWQMDDQHQLGIFEAGISRAGEMDALEQIIQPTLGILTNIGTAHDEGFASQKEKLEEKIKLFTRAERVICRYQDIVESPVQESWITWGEEAASEVQASTTIRSDGHTDIRITWKGDSFFFQIPFTDRASIENAITVWIAARILGADVEQLAAAMQELTRVDMRLEIKKGINQCTIINDSYSLDLTSLQIALDFMEQQPGQRGKTVILSDVQGSQSSIDYARIFSLVDAHGVGRIIGIGRDISAALAEASPAMPHASFPDTEAFLDHFRSTQFRDELILIKGARVFGFERIVQLLELKLHDTILEINLGSVLHNLRTYQQFLSPGTKVMAMVKAFAYGSGGSEIASVLQFHQVDYLGVAYADEGVEIRKMGVQLPIMVMNPEESAFDAMVEYHLEPDIYSFDLLDRFERYLEREGLRHYPVHLEIETGMNRLGFATDSVEQLASRVAKSEWLRVQSVFSHLASSEDPVEDEFTLGQYEKFVVATETLQHAFGYSFIKHIANTSAISRLPQLQLDMVRLGIGLYGVDPSGEHAGLLEPAATLRSTVAQIKKIQPGESVGYNRRGVSDSEMTIATIRIGYADGYSRRLGYGHGKMLVRGRLAPVVGTVCMDMTMIDVTDIPDVKEGDDVVIFGKGLPVQQVAAWAGTIAYEIMTGISQRVKRVYFEE